MRKNDSEGDKRKPLLKKISCLKNVEKSEFLPSIFTTNVQSLGPKIVNFIEEIKMREITLALLSETWRKDDNLHYQRKITYMLELQGLNTVSLNKKTRRGGAVAMVSNT